MFVPYDPTKHRGMQLYTTQAMRAGQMVTDMLTRADVTPEAAQAAPWGYMVWEGEGDPSADLGSAKGIENDLIAAALAEKGGEGSGNWGHTSHTRVGKGRGGSDPGGGLGAIGVDRSATAQERQEAAQAHRAPVLAMGPAPRQAAADFQAVMLANLPVRTPRAKEQYGIDYIAGDIVAQGAGGQGAFPGPLYQAAYGLAYARQTGRVSGSTELALRKLDDHATIRLLSEMAGEEVMPYQAGRWLNARQSEIAAGWPKGRGSMPKVSKPKPQPSDILTRHIRTDSFYVQNPPGSSRTYKKVTGYPISMAGEMRRHDLFVYEEPGARLPWWTAEARTGLDLPFMGGDRAGVVRMVREAFDSGRWTAARLDDLIRQEYEQGGERRVSPRYREAKKATQEMVENELFIDAFLDAMEAGEGG